MHFSWVASCTGGILAKNWKTATFCGMTSVMRVSSGTGIICEFPMLLTWLISRDFPGSWGVCRRDQSSSKGQKSRESLLLQVEDARGIQIWGPYFKQDPVAVPHLWLLFPPKHMWGPLLSRQPPPHSQESVVMAMHSTRLQGAVRRSFLGEAGWCMRKTRAVAVAIINALEGPEIWEEVTQGSSEGGSQGTQEKTCRF